MKSHNFKPCSSRRELSACKKSFSFLTLVKSCHRNPKSSVDSKGLLFFQAMPFLSSSQHTRTNQLLQVTLLKWRHSPTTCTTMCYLKCTLHTSHNIGTCFSAWTSARDSSAMESSLACWSEQHTGNSLSFVLHQLRVTAGQSNVFLLQCTSSTFWN